MAEAVDRRDPGGIELSCELEATRVDEPLPDAVAELPGGTLRVGDDEQESTSSALADGLDEPPTSTVVFPVPAPAETKTTPGASIAATCSGFGAFTGASPGTSERGHTTTGTRIAERVA